MNYCETYQYEAEGYQKLFHHHNWRVAILNFIDELNLDQIKYVEAHSLTDEVFVLLQGKAYLFFAEEVNLKITKMICLPLESGKIYKIPAGVFHTHTLSIDAKLLIVEDENTGYENSPRIYLGEKEQKELEKVYLEVQNAV